MQINGGKNVLFVYLILNDIVWNGMAVGVSLLDTKRINLKCDHMEKWKNSNYQCNLIIKGLHKAKKTRYRSK